MLTHQVSTFKPGMSSLEFAVRYLLPVVGFAIMGAGLESVRRLSENTSRLRDTFTKNTAKWALATAAIGGGISYATHGIQMYVYNDRQAKAAEAARVEALPAIAPDSVIKSRTVTINKTIADKNCLWKAGQTIPVTFEEKNYKVTCPKAPPALQMQ